MSLRLFQVISYGPNASKTPEHERMYAIIASITDPKGIEHLNSLPKDSNVMGLSTGIIKTKDGSDSMDVKFIFATYD